MAVMRRVFLNETIGHSSNFAKEYAKHENTPLSVVSTSYFIAYNTLLVRSVVLLTSQPTNQQL